MELVNTGRCVRNPLQHKDFRRFQNCRHRPQQTRKCQVRTRLEIRCTGNSTVGSNPTRCAMNNSSTNWWSYYSYHGGIRKAALSDMPVACRNRRGFSAEKESHPLRHVGAKSAPLKIRQLEASCRILRLCFLAPPFQIEPTSLGFDSGFFIYHQLVERLYSTKSTLTGG